MVLDNIGSDWLIDRVGGLTDHLDILTPVQVNEANRYLTVGRYKGHIDYGVTPFLGEILNCFDVNSPVREINLLKGVQIGYSTLLEGGALYFVLQVPGTPIMYMSADKELAESRVADNYVPMIKDSGLDHLYANMSGGNRKSAQKDSLLQFVGGTTIRPFGAKNAAKMRNYSIMVFLKDEIDAWAENVGKDGDPDKLTDARCEQYWEVRKIFRGSTPTIKQTSKIYKQFRRGDERCYMFNCLSCGFEQTLVSFTHDKGPRWYGKNRETGKRFGFVWDSEEGLLVPESVRYLCRNCGHEHFDYHKEIMLSPDNGAYWKPTSKPVRPGIRSYYLPAFYSPFKKWSERIADFLEAWDMDTRKPKSISEFQVFFNNVIAWPFEVSGERIRLEVVSYHRRICYKKGEIPNSFAKDFAGSRILFLTCQVDVHKDNLAVAVMGWTIEGRCFVIDYRRLEPDIENGEPPCTEVDSPVWGDLREIIEEAEFSGDDGVKYKVFLTLIDAGYAHDTVLQFCSDYDSGVVPILGRDRPTKAAKIVEFSEFKTKIGTVGYNITADHYKDRLAPVLRREWSPESGDQRKFHFNAPSDITQKELKELTAEKKVKSLDNKGNESFSWHRPSGAKNELWDLLVYGHAAVDIIAYNICVVQHEKDDVVWPEFWQYMEDRLEIPED